MVVLLIVIVSFLATIAGADEVEELIGALKPSPLDYAAWAGSLLGAVDELKDNPDAQGRLYEKAYELGIRKPKGHPTAIKAARALLETRPDQKAAWQRKLLAVYELDWQAADRTRKKAAGKTYVEQMIALADDRANSDRLAEAIQLYTDASRMVRYYAPELRDAVAGKLKDVRGRQKLQQDLARCKDVLAAKPDNAAVRERLIRLYVVELDQPGEAAKLLTADVSERLRTYVPLAVKQDQPVAREVCMELGDWYRSLTAGATRTGQVNVLIRAEDYYQRLVVLETNTVKRTIAKAKFAQVEKELEKLVARKYIVLQLGKGVTMEIVRIRAGKFLMGSHEAEKGRGGNEGPQHNVTISKPFYMGVTEVTQKQYAAVTGKKPSKFIGRLRPVECVSWNEAVAFCKRLSAITRRGVRLPTEAEWEYACRAGTKTAYSFGNDSKDLAAYGWCKTNSNRKTQSVRQKKPNAWGLYDMHGSVFEWCSDWYAESYAKAKNQDPQGPTSGSKRVLRGGSGFHDLANCRSAFRLCLTSDARYNSLGFRVAVDLK